MRIAWLERKKTAFAQWALHHARGPYATPFLFLFSFAESVVSPFPVEVVLAPLVVARARPWHFYALVAAGASVAGGVVGYGVGLLFFETVGAYLVRFYGLEETFVTTAALLAQSTFVATFAAAFTPIPYKLFTLAAGFLHAPFAVFVAASVLGRSIRFVAFSYIVDLWGPALARAAMRNFTVATALVVALMLIVITLYLL